jgi:hypothetical protein
MNCVPPITLTTWMRKIKYPVKGYFVKLKMPGIMSLRGASPAVSET